MALNLNLDPLLYESVDVLLAFLTSEGYTRGTVNDRLFAYLGDQGYDGALPDRMAAWIEAGGATGLPIISGVPTITGTPVIGQTLTATAAPVSGDAPITRTWQWTRDGSDISGAVLSSYVLAEADDLADIRVRQIETNALDTDTATSAFVEVAYNAPTAANALPDLTLPVNVAMTPVDVKADFSVTGDEDLSGLTVALQSGTLPTGLSFDGEVLSGTPTVVAGAATLVFRATNSGGSVDTAFEVTVSNALTITLDTLTQPDNNVRFTYTATADTTGTMYLVRDADDVDLGSVTGVTLYADAREVTVSGLPDQAGVACRLEFDDGVNPRVASPVLTISNYIYAVDGSTLRFDSFAPIPDMAVSVDGDTLSFQEV